MKRIIALFLVLTMALCGCGKEAEPSVMEAPVLSGAVADSVPAEDAAVQETEAPTTVPTTEPEVYFDPLNGEILDAPYDGRIYASTISNIPDALSYQEL